MFDLLYRRNLLEMHNYIFYFCDEVNDNLFVYGTMHTDYNMNFLNDIVYENNLQGLNMLTIEEKTL